MKANPWMLSFINIGHALDHLAMLIFPTVVLALSRELNQSYAELLPLTVGGFIAFGACSIPAGYLGDRWSRYKMLVVFFFGIGVMLLLTGCAQTPWQIALGLTGVGLFGAIYHPVATAMIITDPARMGYVLGVNGLWGNLGLAFAAIIAGGLMDWLGWRWAFYVPGVICLACGVAFIVLVQDPGPIKKTGRKLDLHMDFGTVLRIVGILLVATICGGIIFNATTIGMPKVFDERLRGLTETGMGLGLLVALVYCIGALAQLVVGPLIDKVDLRRLLIPIAAAQVGLLWLAGASQGWMMLGVAILLMLAVFGQIPLNDAIVGRYTADEYRSRVFAIRYVVTLGVASFAVPLIAYLHRTTGGFEQVFRVLAVFALFTLIASCFFPSRAALQAQHAQGH
jgi:MFS family permease